MERRLSWWSSPNLYPLWSSLAFVFVIATLCGLEVVEGILDRRFIPRDIWEVWIHIPILPIEWAFGGYRWELWSHWHGSSAHGEPELLFDSACYAIAASVYREVWRQIRGRRSPGSWILLGFISALLLLQLIVASGWGVPGVRC